MRRALVTVATSLASVVVSGAPAAGAGVAASNYLTRLRGVEPPVTGVEVAVIEIGNRLELVNRTGTEVTVLGYEDEPYLRVGPAGVFENRRSPATYLNRDRQATTPVPEDADPAAAPEWRRVSSAREARWYDHRVHWMGAIDPPGVRHDPGERHVIIPEWTVPFRHGDTRFNAFGDLVWVPGPSPAPWVLMAAVPLGLGVLLLGAALWVGSRSWWARPLAAGVGLLIAVSAAGELGRAWASPGTIGGRLADVVTSRPGVVLAWVAGIGAIALLLRRRRAGLYLAAVAGVGVVVFGGLVGLSDLSRSQVPSTLGSGLARATVAWSLGIGLAVVALSAAAGSRARATAREAAP